MNKELKIFTNDIDEQSILEILLSNGGELEKSYPFQWFFRYDEAFIQLLRCMHVDDTAIVGRVAIRTSNELQGKDRAESAFRKLERNIKKNFNNNLVVQNLDIEGSESNISRIWLGPQLENELKQKKIKLKQGEDSPIVFNLNS